LLFNGVASMPNGSQLSEIVLTHSTMTNDDRQKLEGYLAYKWGLTYALPANHPYRWDTSLFGGTNLNGFDTDALAYITAVETADVQELELGVKTAINNFIVGAKADGIWDAIKSSAILAGARTLNGALVPLKGTAPTNFNFVSGDYNRKTGLLGDGSTKYLNSNRNNNADPQNSKHVSIFISTAGTSPDNRFAGSPSVGSNGYSLLAQTVPALLVYVGANRISNFTPISTSHITGLFGVNRSISTQEAARVNGANTTSTVASSSPVSGNITFFQAGSGTYTNARLAFYSIGESLDLALLDTRITQLITDYANAIP
jgi:hypothetical protein